MTGVITSRGKHAIYLYISKRLEYISYEVPVSGYFSDYKLEDLVSDLSEGREVILEAVEELEL